jgi:hypothetical protein
MLRFRSRLLVPALALIVLGFLFPVLAQALPVGDGALSAAERPETTGTGRLSQLWSLLAALWSETGSGLEPDGPAPRKVFLEPRTTFPGS